MRLIDGRCPRCPSSIAGNELMDEPQIAQSATERGMDSRLFGCGLGGGEGGGDRRGWRRRGNGLRVKAKRG